MQVHPPIKESKFSVKVCPGILVRHH
jgi:hypothetical protein